ncbi:hypothetical protein C7I87_23980 [Mesorhizobium sp. SARCC-RB16n]|nr:hypothetical protein C7I87_23980 [Mesorhizobium sp. SARCC-RB16n]
MTGHAQDRRSANQAKARRAQGRYQGPADLWLSPSPCGAALQPKQLFHWRKLATQGALAATSAEGEVVAASEYRAAERPRSWSPKSVRLGRVQNRRPPLRLRLRQQGPDFFRPGRVECQRAQWKAYRLAIDWQRTAALPVALSHH